MQKVKVTDKFLALIEKKKLVSFNELNEQEKEIFDWYNRYHVEDSTDFFDLVSFLIELKTREDEVYQTAKKNILIKINKLCKKRNLELFVS